MRLLWQLEHSVAMYPVWRPGELEVAMAKLKEIKVPKVERDKVRLCDIRPKLDGSQGNPMRFCDRKAGHPGKHSWEWDEPTAPSASTLKLTKEGTK
jgi:hypothetical protein